MLNSYLEEKQRYEKAAAWDKRESLLMEEFSKKR